MQRNKALAIYYEPVLKPLFIPCFWKQIESKYQPYAELPLNLHYSKPYRYTLNGLNFVHKNKYFKAETSPFENDANLPLL